MRKTRRSNRLSAKILCLVTANLLSLSVQGQTAEFSPTEQCSLAVVSRFVAKSDKVCDAGTVLRLAHQGHVYQQNQIGIASVLAIGPGYSIPEALRWFQKAAQNGYAPAQVNLAVMYANGWGAPQNYGVALQWLRAASEQHYARADYNLGIFYMQGTGVRRDYNEALRWFQKAAAAGDSSQG